MKRSREESGVDANEGGDAPAAKKTAVESTTGEAADPNPSSGDAVPPPAPASAPAVAAAPQPGGQEKAKGSTGPVESEAPGESKELEAESTAPGKTGAIPAAASGDAAPGPASVTGAAQVSSDTPPQVDVAAPAAPAAPVVAAGTSHPSVNDTQTVDYGKEAAEGEATQSVAAASEQPVEAQRQASAPPAAEQPQQQGKLKVEDALAYLAKVKGEFHNDEENPHIYNLFLDIMKNFKSQQIDTPGVISQVSQLFRGHDHLILGFNTFLPPDQKISEEQLRKMNESHKKAMKEKKASKAAADASKSSKPKKGKKSKSAQNRKVESEENRQVQQNLMQQTASQIPQAGQGGQPPFGFEHAITYVTKIKTRFEHDSAKYTRFLDILHDYKEDKQSIEGVLEQVSELFKDHSDLLKEFAYFLPEAVQEQATARLAQAAASHQSGKKRRGKGKSKSGKDDKTSRSKKKQKTKKGQNASNDMGAGMHPSMIHGGMHPGMMGHPSMMGQHPGLMGHPGMMPAHAGMQPGTYAHPGMYAPHTAHSMDQPGAPSISTPAAPEPKAPPKLPLVEKKYFERVKKALGQESLWHEFLKCLELYAHDLLSRVELLSLLADIVAVCPDGGEELIDELEDVLVSRGDENSKSGNEEYWLSMPTTEIDFSQCRRCTPSYRALPHNYPRGTCSGRTTLCESVLNNNWVSVPTGSEDFGAKNQRRNQYEDALFKCEDDRYEMDMVMDANRSAIKALEPIALAIKSLEEQGKADRAKQADGGVPPADDGSTKKYQYRLDKRALSVMHLKAIARVYGDAGDRVLELLRKNPAGAIPVILSRLKQKAVEWGQARQHLDKQWKEVLEKNYQKSLDHRSFYFKTHDRKAVMAKTLIQEAKVSKRRADAKAKKSGKAPTLPGMVSVPSSSVEGVADQGASDPSKEQQAGILQQADSIVANSHLTFALPDVEAHRDVWALMDYAAKHSSGSGQTARFTTEESKKKLTQFISEILHPLLGSEVPLSWVGAKLGSPSVGSKFTPNIKIGNEVSTPYGVGKISNIYSKGELVCVDIPSGPSFIAASNLLKPDAEAPNCYATTDEDKSPVLLMGNNKLYVFVRLYIMVYNRLRRAKELCRRASSQKRPFVRHWKDRVTVTPRSPQHQPHLASPDISSAQLQISAASPVATSASSTTGVTTPAAQGTDDDAALQSQIKSSDAYKEFLGHVLTLMSGKMESSAFEDHCRTLMGASTASYMMFTLDKLLAALMKQAALICEESESESTAKLTMLFKKESGTVYSLHTPKDSDATASKGGKKAGKKTAKKKTKTTKDGKGKKKSVDVARYKSRALKVPYDALSNLPDNLFRVHFVPGLFRKSQAKAGSHGPGVWDETMVWEVQPQICFELVGETSKLRKEVSLDASVVGAEVYVERYLTESGSSGFGGHILGQGAQAVAPASDAAAASAETGPKGGKLFLNRNKKKVKSYLEKQGSLGYEDKDTGRDRRARDQLNLLRHSLSWGLGTIKTNDGLAAASSLDTDKLRFVAGSEDFMYRITIQYHDKDGENSHSSSSSAEDDGDDVEMHDADESESDVSKSRGDASSAVDGSSKK